MVSQEEDVFLIFSVLDLLLINQDIFIDSFHGVQLARELVHD
jgi:hypothetical protein